MIEIKVLNKPSKFPTQIVNWSLSRLVDILKSTIELSQPSFKVKRNA